MYQYYEPNPKSTNEGDCVVRAISKALGKSWGRTYVELCLEGFIMGTWGDVNKVWDRYLRQNGFKRHNIPDTCPDCYTVEKFVEEHPRGTFVLATGNHAVTVQDGVIYDTFDSSKAVPIYYYIKEQADAV